MEHLGNIRGRIQHLSHMSNFYTEFLTQSKKVTDFLDLPEVPQECLISTYDDQSIAIKIEN